jgi:hypothetical protein
MVEPGIKLRIASPTELFMKGSGFYQLEEDALYVQLGQTDADSRFFSFIEAPNMRLDLDRTGRLLFIEVNAGRHTWIVDDDLRPPPSIGYADIRWLDFRREIAAPALSCNATKTSLCIQFSDLPITRSYCLAQSVIVRTTSEDCLASLIITDIVDDLAGQEIAAFRKELRGQNSPKTDRQ